MYPNNNNNNNNNIKNIYKSQMGRTIKREWRERGEERDFIYLFIFSLLLFQIYGNRTIDFCRSRRQSWFTRRELRVGTNILAFRQSSRGRKFSYLCYFEPKGYVFTLNFLRARERP